MIQTAYLPPVSAPAAPGLPLVGSSYRAPSRPPEPAALRLKGSWFRTRGFATRRPGEPLTAPPRTVGTVCLQLGTDSPFSAGASEAAEVCVRRPGPPPSEESAREKVVLTSLTGDTLVYQADRESQTASLCACGNASGASAALLAEYLGETQTQQKLILPDGQVGMHTRVTSAESGWHVEQSWVGIRFAARTCSLFGRQVIVCTGTLNDYLLVEMPGMDNLDAFGVEAAGAFWEQARQLFGFDDPLRARLAAFCLSGQAPRGKFFTCGRAHPGAPLTGLAVLALAARENDRLASLARAGRLEHRRGIDLLPAVRQTTRDGTCVDLPTIHVQLQGA